MDNNSIAKQARGIAKNTINFSRAAVRRMREILLTLVTRSSLVRILAEKPNDTAKKHKHDICYYHKCYWLRVLPTKSNALV